MLGFTKEELEKNKGIFTVEEIAQQPDTWRETVKQLESAAEPLQEFIKDVTDRSGEIILTGAGTSEYVGNALYPALKTRLGGRIHSVGTTDIVASPESFIPKEGPLLLVSFARSGNSPESVGAVKAAERVCSEVKHLFITCNKDGALAKIASEKDNCFSLVLDPRTHDRSFAMTSSFTNMYLAALIAFGACGSKGFGNVISAGEALASDGYKVIQKFVSENDFNRIVYLGTDVLKGIAQESALKILELTAGQIVALYDTPMGFRHGPKSVIDGDTVTVIYISEDPHTRRYEMDLLKEVYRDKGASKVIAIASLIDDTISENSDLAVEVAAGEADAKAAGDTFVPNFKLALPYVMAAQILAVSCSLKLGITPDNPCPTGEVNRVVQGVTIYE